MFRIIVYSSKHQARSQLCKIRHDWMDRNRMKAKNSFENILILYTIFRKMVWWVEERWKVLEYDRRSSEEFTSNRISDVCKARKWWKGSWKKEKKIVTSGKSAASNPFSDWAQPSELSCFLPVIPLSFFLSSAISL